MSKLIKSAFVAALVFAFPMAVNAQEEAAPEACQATITSVHSGQVASASVVFPVPFGDVTSIQGELKLATEEEVGMVEMAADEAGEEAVDMANDANTSTIWLNTLEVEAGTYALILMNESGDACVAEVTVEDPAGL